MHLQVNIIEMLGRDPPSPTTVFLFKGRLKALYPGPEDQGPIDPESYSGVEIQLIMLQAQITAISCMLLLCTLKALFHTDRNCQTILRTL